MKRSLIIICGCIILLLGCMSNGEHVDSENDIDEWDELDPSFEDPEKVKLRILTNLQEKTFMESYGNDILEELDYLELEIISIFYFPHESDRDPQSKLEKIIKEDDIDIIFPDIYYQEWANEEWMVPLEIYMTETYLNVNQDLVEVLKSSTDGRIYGLAPMFEGFALLYNQDIFDHYQVEYPRNNMSWQEVYVLASHFPVSEMTGFDYGSRLDSLLFIKAVTNQIDIVDESGENVLIGDNEAWNEIMELTITGLQEEYVKNEWQLFQEGEAAMTIMGSYLLDYIYSDGFDFEWQMVTAPVDPRRPTEGNMISPFNIAGISAFSEKQEYAWEVIQFLNSSTYAQVLEERYSYLLVGNYPTIEESKAALYALTPTGYSSKWYTHPSLQWNSQFLDMLADTMQSILSEEMTLEEGIYYLQSEGQLLLNEHRAKER